MSAAALNAALACPLYSGGRRALLLVLAWRANDERGHCVWMSKRTMGREAGLHPNNVRLYLREFERDGILQPVGEVIGQSKTYHFNVGALPAPVEHQQIPRAYVPKGGNAGVPPTGNADVPQGERRRAPTGNAGVPLKKKDNEKKTERKGSGARPDFRGVVPRLPNAKDARPARTAFNKAVDLLERHSGFSRQDAARHLMDLSSDEIDNLLKGQAA